MRDPARIDTRAIKMEAARQLMADRWPEYEWRVEGDAVLCAAGSVSPPLREGEPWLAGFIGADGHTSSGIGPGPRVAFSRARVRAGLE